MEQQATATVSPSGPEADDDDVPATDGAAPTAQTYDDHLESRSRRHQHTEAAHRDGTSHRAIGVDASPGVAGPSPSSGTATGTDAARQLVSVHPPRTHPPAQPPGTTRHPAPTAPSSSSLPGAVTSSAASLAGSAAPAVMTTGTACGRTAGDAAATALGSSTPTSGNRTPGRLSTTPPTCGAPMSAGAPPSVSTPVPPGSHATDATSPGSLHPSTASAALPQQAVRPSSVAPAVAAGPMACAAAVPAAPGVVQASIEGSTAGRRIGSGAATASVVAHAVLGSRTGEHALAAAAPPPAADGSAPFPAAPVAPLPDPVPGPAVPAAPGAGGSSDVFLSGAGHDRGPDGDALRAAVFSADGGAFPAGSPNLAFPDVVVRTANATDDPRDWPG